MRTVVGLYNRMEEAQGAVKMLHKTGFTKEDINLIARDTKGEYTRYLEKSKQGEGDDITDGAAAGAGVGAVIGGLGGLLLGLGALAIPGIGPVIAAGPIASTLIGAGAGAVTGGIVGALVDLGIPKEHAEAYAEGIRRGGTLVTVRAEDHRSDDAVRILEHFNPVDINEQAQSWRGANWHGFDEHAGPYEMDQLETSRRENIPITGRDQGIDFPVVEEELHVGKRTVDTGGVRVESDIREGPYEEDVEPRQERVNADDLQGFNRGFRSHFDRHYAAQGMDYNDVMPAYRYGYSLASDRRFQDYDWDGIEPEARVAWERRYGQNTWNRIRDAVQHAWNEARS